jgi:hypothetical protein
MPSPKKAQNEELPEIPWDALDQQLKAWLVSLHKAMEAQQPKQARYSRVDARKA